MLQSLRVSLITLFSTVIVFTAGTIIFLTEREHSRSTLEISDRLIETSVDGVVARVVGYFSPAQRSARLISDYVADHPGALDADSTSLMSFMTSLLSAHEHLSSLTVAGEQGQFFQIRRDVADSGTAVFIRRRIDLVDGFRVEKRTQVALQGGAEYGERVMLTEYDPRQRPWYRTDKAGWSDVYLFATEGVPGVTASHPIIEQAGSPLGVATADLTVGRLVHFLLGQKISANSEIFILANSGEIVAHPDPLIYGRAKELGRALPVGDDIERPASRQAVSLRTDSDGPGRVGFELEGESFIAVFVPFPDDFGKDWTVVAVVPVDDLLGNAKQTRLFSLVFCLFVLLIGVLSAAFIAQRVSRPIRRLAEQVENVKSFQFDNDFTYNSNILEVSIMSSALQGMQAGLQSFSRFVPANLVHQLLAAGEVARLGGEERRVTILFSDLRGYSTIIETLPPTKVVEMLTEYFGAMQEVIEAHHGCVLEYIGDAILVVFGAPADLEDQSTWAVQCAVAMRDRLQTLNAHWDTTGLSTIWKGQGYDSLSARIGVHTGTVVAGNLGSDTLMKYGVVGDVVNIAARLEQYNKELGTTILFGREVRDGLPSALQEQAEDQGLVSLKGRAQPQQVFSV